MSTRKKAIILARVSTKGQADEELPIASQLEACRAKAVELDVDVVREFIEDGVSGRKERRDTFHEAVDYCGVFDIEYFILWDTARFARNKALAAWTKLTLRRGGTTMVYVAQNIDTSTDEGWLLEGLHELFDEQKSRTVSKDTRRSMMKNARDGYFNGGRVPFGYRVVPEGKRRRLAIDEPEASLVRRIFDECLAGSGAKSIARWLNGSGQTLRGRPWSKTGVAYMLTNWVYAGYSTFNRRNYSTRGARPQEEWIRTKSHPAIVDEEDFMATLKLIRGRAPETGNSARSEFRFTGIIRCERCNVGMKIMTGTGRSRTYSYYRCSAALQGRSCDSRPIPAEALDRWLLDALRVRILARDRIAEVVRQVHDLSGEWVRDRAEERSRLVRDLRDAEARRARLFEVLELQGRDAPNLGDLSARLRQLNGQIRDLERSLAELEERPAPAFEPTEAQVSQLTDFVADMLEHGSPRKVREFLQTFVERVVVRDRDAVIHYHPGRLVNAAPVEVVRSTEKWLPDRVKLRTATLGVPLPERYWRMAA